MFFAAGWLPFVWGGCLAAFLFPVCVLRALLVEGSILFIKGAGFCAGVVGCFCVRLVVHSLFGLVTMLRFFSVLHIGIPLLAFRAGGGFLCPGVVVLNCSCWRVGVLACLVWWVCVLRARLCVADSLVFRVV